MLIIAGNLTIDPDEQERYLAGVEQVEAAARKAPGCLDFVQAADRTDPARINVYERWESDEDLLRFRSLGEDPTAGMPEITGASVAKYRISAVEAP